MNQKTNQKINIRNEIKNELNTLNNTFFNEHGQEGYANAYILNIVKKIQNNENISLSFLKNTISEITRPTNQIINKVLNHEDEQTRSALIYNLNKLKDSKAYKL